MQQTIVGKWQQPAGQPYPGLWFEFTEDGVFSAYYDDMGIESGGTYTVNNSLIYMDQTKHTLGLIGKFEGRYGIEGDILKMALGNPGEKTPDDLSKARQYKKM